MKYDKCFRHAVARLKSERRYRVFVESLVDVWKVLDGPFDYQQNIVEFRRETATGQCTFSDFKKAVEYASQLHEGVPSP
jgi:hypothetical protein